MNIASNLKISRRVFQSVRNVVRSTSSRPRIRIIIGGTGYRSTPRFAMVVSGRQSYLVNCSEGAARVIVNSRIGTRKINHVFLTSNTWYNMAGMFSLFLDVQDVYEQIAIHKDIPEDSHVRVHGPKVAVEAVNKMTVEKFRKLRPLILSDIFNQPLVNEEFEVHGLTFTEANSASAEFPDRSYAYLFKDIGCGTAPNTDVEKHLHEMFPGRHKIISTTTAAPFMFVENASQEHVLTKLACPRLAGLLARCPPHLVVHFTPASVHSTDEHRRFLGLFPDDAHHLIVDAAEPSINPLTALSQKQAVLHYFSSRRAFPLPADLPTRLSAGDGSPCSPLSDADWRCLDAAFVNAAMADAAEPPPTARRLPDLGARHAFAAQPLLSVDAATRAQRGGGLAWSAEAQVASLLLHSKLTSLADFHRRVQRHEARVAAAVSAGRLPTTFSAFPKVAFLGTASAAPNLDRNTAGVLVRTAPGAALLLDCGESSLMQLRALYGREADAVLRSVRLVCLSHRHADHHMGLMQLLAERQRLRAAGQVHVVAPPNLAPILAQHRRWFGRAAVPRFRFHAADEGGLAGGGLDEALREVGLELSAVRVLHCAQALGFVLRHRDGWSVVYSGDTKPCGALVRAGVDCDLLIHEATFDSHLRRLARLRGHSTVDQAVEIGAQMRARFTMLTHFSRRASVFDTFGLRELPARVGIARDLMEVTFEDLPYLRFSHDLLKSLVEFSRRESSRTAMKCRSQRREASRGPTTGARRRV